jgi:hypothetical protein
MQPKPSMKNPYLEGGVNVSSPYMQSSKLSALPYENAPSPATAAPAAITPSEKPAAALMPKPKKHTALITVLVVLAILTFLGAAGTIAFLLLIV